MTITNITLDNTSIIEGSPTGTLVGNITVSGDFVDIPVVYTTSTQFSIALGTPNKLVVLDSTSLDFESQPSVNVTIGAYIRKRISEITKTGTYNVIKTTANHNLSVGDSVVITSTLNTNADNETTSCDGTFTVVSVPDETTFYIDLVPTFTFPITYGYVYTSKLEETIEISVTDSSESKSIIYSVTPQISKTTTFPEITISGLKFTEGGSPIVILNGVEQTLTSYSDTSIVFTLVDDLAFGVYDLTVVNGYEQTQLQSNPLYEEDLVSIKFIRYLTDKSVSYSLGNTNCYVKPTIQLVYDTDGASGKYGSIMSVIPPNVYMTYLNIYLKHNANFDFNVGGEVVLDTISLLSGDLVWLSNQIESSENGIYLVSSGAWTFVQAVDSNTFIDLGARATDQIDGNISRNIVIDQHITFGKSGFYSITYYALNSLGILSKTIRKVKILTSTASISPSDSYRVTDYLIKSEADSQLLTSGALSSDNDSSVCCKPGSTSGEYINKNGTVTFIANQSMGGYKLTNLGNATSDTDAVNLGQVKSLISLSNTVGSTQIAGESIDDFQAVFIHTDGKVYVANSDDIDQMGKIIGIASSAKGINEEINIISFGKISGLSSLQGGSNYYISNTGYLSYIPPTIGFVQIMGIALSSTEFMLLMQPPIGLEQ